MPKKLLLYCNQITGNIWRGPKQEAKNLSADWKPVNFVKNDKGEAVMRFEFDGAIVDVQETDTPLPEKPKEE